MAAKRMNVVPDVEPGAVGHPLFPAIGDEPEVLGIGSITVARWNPKVGSMEYAPQRFNADELTDLVQLAERFGGGKYELIGRTAAGNRILKKVHYQVAGPSKKLFEESDDEPAATSQHTVPVAVPTASAPSRSSFEWAQLLPMLVPIVLEYLKTSAADRLAMLARSDQTMQLMMQQQQASSQAFITAMSQLFAKSGGGGNSSGDFQAGISWMENFIAGKMEAAQADGKTDDSGELLKVLGQAFEAAKLMGVGSGGAPPGAPPAPAG